MLRKLEMILIAYLSISASGTAFAGGTNTTVAALTTMQQDTKTHAGTPPNEATSIPSHVGAVVFSGGALSALGPINSALGGAAIAAAASLKPSSNLQARAPIANSN
jgi:hypothetical protein